MSKSLKTYPDGSELTVGMVAVTAVVSTVLAAVGVVAVVKWDAWREKRIMKKYNIEPNNM